MSTLISTTVREGQVITSKDVQDGFYFQPVARKVSEVAGVLGKYKKAKPVSVEEMDLVLAQHIRDEDTL
ncbi:MAG: hypothetical protein CR963_01145 [Gammaproteobacteria bacterium]|nr:MAG: hypothetical protein CR963_01145 [Gammaproteobacteria bacterium]